ncbi:hypothetical protein CH371_05695 [Leptospira wolffii]|uniref:Uncharacterized protein n=1 Tax=Leptospira wolffii TaxID=409998 RepID=A0A2M9ZGE6_9LEPT|nr:hypothetical protein CH371_05695 [Leptospira wolffii]
MTYCIVTNRMFAYKWHFIEKLIQAGKIVTNIEYSTDLLTVGWLPLLPFSLLNLLFGNCRERVANSFSKTVVAFKNELVRMR